MNEQLHIRLYDPLPQIQPDAAPAPTPSATPTPTGVVC